jgi:hypothetical protein
MKFLMFYIFSFWNRTDYFFFFKKKKTLDFSIPNVWQNDARRVPVDLFDDKRHIIVQFSLSLSSSRLCICVPNPSLYLIFLKKKNSFINILANKIDHGPWFLWSTFQKKKFFFSKYKSRYFADKNKILKTNEILFVLVIIQK